MIVILYIHWCNYCKSKNLIIITTNDGDFTDECITAFYNNNFTGKNVIIKLYILVYMSGDFINEGVTNDNLFIMVKNI